MGPSTSTNRVQNESNRNAHIRNTYYESDRRTARHFNDAPPTIVSLPPSIPGYNAPDNWGETERNFDRSHHPPRGAGFATTDATRASDSIWQNSALGAETRARRASQRPVVPPIITNPRDDNTIHSENFSARNSLREAIFSAMMAETLYPAERITLLEDCRVSVSASNLGIPFRDLLSEPMDMLGVPPLMYEIMSCKPEWGDMLTVVNGQDDTMAVVMYLIENWRENTTKHGRMGSLEWCIRTACLRRLDPDSGNRVFQIIRTGIKKREAITYVDWQDDITVETKSDALDAKQDSGFRVLLNLPAFDKRLAQSLIGSLADKPFWNEDTNFSSSSNTANEKRAKPKKANVTVDFLASSRAWRLEIGGNSLKLTLLDDGDDMFAAPDGHATTIFVDARLNIILPTPSTGTYQERVANGRTPPLASDPVQVLLPGALMRPRSKTGRGTHEILLAQCFYPSVGSYDSYVPRGMDDPALLHDKTDGSLSMELIVDLSVVGPSDGSSFMAPISDNHNPLYSRECGPPRDSELREFMDPFASEMDHPMRSDTPSTMRDDEPATMDNSAVLAASTNAMQAETVSPPDVAGLPSEHQTAFSEAPVVRKAESAHASDLEDDDLYVQEGSNVATSTSFNSVSEAHMQAQSQSTKGKGRAYDSHDEFDSDEFADLPDLETDDEWEKLSCTMGKKDEDDKDV